MNRLYIFDFDGTLSWIRHGWPEIMSDVLRAYLPLLPGEETAARERHLQHVVYGLSGQPTLVQMEHFVDCARGRQQPTPDAEALYAVYQQRLADVIESRVEALRSGRAQRADFTIRGAFDFLHALADTGATLAVVSGTVEHFVVQEAALLGLDAFFSGRIIGCTGDPTKYRKADVFERLLRETGCCGEELIAFGDGPVEIAETKRLGGYAVALCTSEETLHVDACDPRKQAQLLAAGADEAWPDFTRAVDWLQNRGTHACTPSSP